MTLTWSAIPGYDYRLQYITNLLQSNWVNLGGAIVATNSSIISTNSATNHPARFYRITLVL